MLNNLGSTCSCCWLGCGGGGPPCGMARRPLYAPSRGDAQHPVGPRPEAPEGPKDPLGSPWAPNGPCN